MAKSHKIKKLLPFLFLPLLAILLGWILPMVFMITGLGSIKFSYLQILEQLSTPYTLHLVKVSLFQTCASVFFVFSVGVLLGSVLYYFRVLELPVVRFILDFSFGLPTLVASSSILVILGKGGLWGKLFGQSHPFLFTLYAVILAHVWLNLGWFIKQWTEGLYFAPPELWEACRLMGASRLKSFRYCIWPWIKEKIFWSLYQVWCYCLMSFSLVQILGGGPPTETLETMIYSSFRAGEWKIEKAMACSFWQLLLGAFPLVFLIFFRSQESTALTVKRVVKRQTKNVQKFLVLVLFIVFILPSFSFLIRSTQWSMLSQASIEAIVFSVKLSASSVILALFLGIPAAYVMTELQPNWAKIWSFLILLPGSVSTFWFCLCLWFFYGKWIDFFAGSFISIVAIQTLLLLPWVFKILVPYFRAVPRNEIDAARLMGRSLFGAWVQTQGSKFKRPVMGLLGLGFSFGIGEASAASFFSGDTQYPITVWMMRLMSQYKFDEAMTLCLVLILVYIFSLALSARVTLKSDL